MLLSHQPQPLEQYVWTVLEGVEVSVCEAAMTAVARSRAFLETTLIPDAPALYGINTGFGALCDHRINPDELITLQKNLVLSHACGMGQRIPTELARMVLLLKIQGLIMGYSGVRPAVIQWLVDLYNAGVAPVIYEKGSLGASGDLAPLAHLTLPIYGLGELFYQDKVLPAAQVLQAINFNPIGLEAKEGLALLNGTQFMNAYGVWLAVQAKILVDLATVIGSLSAFAFRCRATPFAPQTHAVRPHAGQIQVAARLFSLLEPICNEPVAVQDPYSFRCMPQVHGASADVVTFFTQTVTTELTAATDNPLVFADHNKIISGGNFHGQPLAMGLDFLAIALAELGSISERRTFQLLSGSRGLPLFLADKPGVKSGFMIVQYTAASMVSQNKQLCTPAVIDSIPSSNNQEDHVSMGANSALKAYEVLQNLVRILAIELMTACKALQLQKKYPLKGSDAEALFMAAINATPPAGQDEDALFFPYLMNMEQLLLQRLKPTQHSGLG